MIKEERKRQLMGMLRAIQDKKSEYGEHVGTAEVFRYLKEVGEVYERPNKITRIINNKLKNSGLDSITYEATPERIFGLQECLNKAEDFDPEALFNGKDPGFYFYQNFPSLQFLHILNIDNHWESGNKMPSHNKKTLEENALAIYDLFRFVNKKGVNNNGDFGVGLIDYIREKYEDIESQIREDLSFKCLAYIENLIKNLSIVNFEEEMDPQNLIERQRKNIEERGFLDIQTDYLVERLIRDQVDHRLRERRMVLCKWLTDNEVESYEDAISKCEEAISSNEEWSDLFEGLPNVIEEMKENPEIDKETKEMIKRLEEGTIGRRDRYLKSLRFIRHVIGSDKNFINKYLRS